MSKQFSEVFIKSRKPKEKKYYIREARGFAIVVHPAGKRNPKGTKTFLYIYTFNGVRKELKLGRHPEMTLEEARIAYHEAYTLHSKGIDPQAEAAKPETEDTDLTFGHFAKLYLEYCKEHNSLGYYQINKLSLENDVLPYWKDRPITELRRQEAIALLERVSSRSKGQVGNVQRAASCVFGYALDRDHIDANPMFRLTKAVPTLKQVSRKRALSEAEIKQIWYSLPEHLKLILITAQRPGEVAGMHMSEIQIGEGKPICKSCRRCGWWTIPPERAKSGNEHMVYLTRTAMDLIGIPDGPVFPSPKDDTRSIHRMALSRDVHRKKSYGLPRWTPHDLRRTARTHMPRIGIIDEHAEAILNHAKEGIKKVYNRYDYQEEKRDALIKWEEELLRIISQA